MWIIASIPFWLIGVLFFLSAGVAIAKSSRPVTDGDVFGIFGVLLLAGVFFMIAAKVAS